MTLRQIILRKELAISSDVDLRRAMLVGYLSLLSISISFFYLVYNIIFAIEDSYLSYIVLMSGSTLSIWLNRNGSHFVAKLVFLFTTNFVVFLFSAKANFETDTHFYYIIISISAFVLFGYARRWVAIGVTFLSIGLFVFSFITGFSILPDSAYPESYIRSNQLINFVLGTIASCTVMYIMIKLNFLSEGKLKLKQEEVTTQNQALQKANEELDRFVYSASHDLRAPLTSILGLTNLARQSKDPAEVEQCLQLINLRVHRLDEFIHDIIDFSRNSRTSVQKENIAVLQTVEHVLDTLKHSVMERPIEFEVNIATDLHWQTDPSRFTIILSNLIGNAIKYFDRAKERSLVHIVASNTLTSYRLSIRDNGIGIPQEHQARIFEMFYRASDTSKGSGLGLYIVKETVDKLSGSIQVQSVFGQGSEFTITLPR